MVFFARLLPVILALAALPALSVSAQSRRDIVSYEDVRIEVISQGKGPLVVLLPSRGRGAEDFDEVAAGIAASGFRVLRPQPRGVGVSVGPMKGQSLHDFSRDIAAAAKAYPTGFSGAKELSEAVRKSGDPALAPEERLKYLRMAFFAPGHDASVWLTGWHPEVDESQFSAGRATKQSEWSPGGNVPLLDLQAENDPFKPREMMNEIRTEFGERATVVVIPNASHALIPEPPAAVVSAIIAWIRKL